MHGFEGQGTYLPEVDQDLLPVQVQVYMRPSQHLLQYTNLRSSDTCVFFVRPP